ncbi:MAG: hypothetical protein KDB14_15345 [Planctomycetales bacterium]|nr:hypothetical protein [Planctomycetales bacterium]
MPRFTLRVMHAAWLVSALLLARYREPLGALLGVRTMPYQTISSQADWDHVISSDRAVIFAHVSWSLASEVGKQKFSQLARKWRATRGVPDVSFYLLDLTEAQASPPEFFSDWIQATPELERLRQTGAGETVWLANGSISLLQAIYDVTVEKLEQQTRMALP